MKKLLHSLLYPFGILFLLSFQSSSNPEYIIIGWNDLGMHCMNKDFSTIAILPPYNNLMAQVIKRGNVNTKPQILTDIGKITYEVPGNTYSVGKTNFWSYAKHLFGVTLQNNIGLTGKGLTGIMDKKDNYFIAPGIPITPFTDNDKKNEDPYQLALLTAYSLNNTFMASTKTVIPVSTEMTCVSSGCHTSEDQIINKHEKEEGFDPKNKPILCASCHSSNALGTKGIPEAKSFSFRIHDQHADEAKDDCYKCHPGKKTQCYRDIMFKAGVKCTQCHGTMKEIAKSIEKGRKPWLEEPSCGNSKCHGAYYAEEKGKLFRQSKGHGGIYCSGCHGSPHAIVPTADYARDNVQNVALQGYKGILEKCQVCHGVLPNGLGPHKLLLQKVSVVDESKPDNGTNLLNPYPNPAKDKISIPFEIGSEGNTHIEIYDLQGNLLITVLNQYLLPAKYSIDANLNSLNSGNYIYILSINGNKINGKFTVDK
jgi:hypothetical protein